MAADWDKAKAAALKILGDRGKVPDIPPNIMKAYDEFTKCNEAFKASREECEAKLLEIENALSASSNTIDQFKAKIEKSDFELDPKLKDEAKKIQQAQKILSGELQTALNNNKDIDKTLKELDKHLIQLGKYKPPKDSI